ncbi:MAG: UDP-N-acetylmuramoyl-L-alanine--D-glutamate ligase [Lachnospiraceae bacterium]|nr:UDP-N-acetylmuramoyl-L-alanine--D-glutamate ligase [Lachnospiraceae bacterium]
MEKKILIAGCGLSGIQAANLMLSQGEDVILYDGNTALDREKLTEQLVRPCEIYLGGPDADLLSRVSYCIISPGIPLDSPLACALKDAGIGIRSEIEAAYLYEKGTVIGITGTNGKTTTTTLVGDIMKAHLGEGKAFTVGNIGVPYAKEVLKTSEDSVTTIELSSFQLETVHSFRPHVSAILNITPDHLNRHHTMECYAEVKERVTMNQEASDFCVLNADDPRLSAFGCSGIAPQVIWFSGTQVLQDGYYLQGDTLYKASHGQTKALIRTDEVHLVGQCNYENILAAIAVTEAMGVPEETVLSVCRDFLAVPHRIEYVRTVNGVRYYNDSKGTNPDAAIQGVKAMTSPTYLIGGGYDKGSDYDEWIASFNGKIKELILMGVTAPKIAECARAHGFANIVFVDSMEEAVREAAGKALPGEAVLLSPACASWGMFRNYEERGDIFKALVNAL